MGRAPCSERELGLKKGAWTAEEDQKLVAFIEKNKGHGSWRTLPQLAGLQRCGKSCRLRWTNYLRPNIKRGDFTLEEERMITQLHALLGNKWSSIASHLSGRTDNEVKNHWNTHMKKRLTRMGIDPTTHRPLVIDSYRAQTAVHNETLRLQDNRNHTSCNPLSKPLQGRRHVNVSLPDQSFVSHMAQWELARLEAEARPAATPSSSSACLLPTEKFSLIKPSGNVVSTTPKLNSSFAWNNSSSSSSSAVGCNKFVKLLSHESQVNLKAFTPPLTSAVAMFATAPQDENSMSLPSFDTSSSASDQCSMSKPKPHAELEKVLYMSNGTVGGGGLTISSISSGWPDAESTSELRCATSPLLPEELLMMSPRTHDEVQAVPPLFDLIPCSPDQACAESGSAYWAHLLHHGLLMGPSTSLSSCPC